MRPRNAAGYGLAAVGASLLLAASPGCGPSDAAKAYSAYEAKAEPLLDREIAVWKKLAEAIEAQTSGEAEDADRLASIVRGETVPFYTAMREQAAAAAPAHASLEQAHAILVQYVDKRLAFARAIVDGLGTLTAVEPALDARNAELERAVSEYAEIVGRAGRPPDSRFNEVMNAQKDFAEQALMPLVEGRATAKDVEERIRSRTLARLKALRNETYADDAEGKALKAAVFAAADFFDAVVGALPRFETSARLKRQTEGLAKEGDDLLRRFREELKAVRQRL